MNYVSIPGLSQRHARMPLKAEQHCHIAAAYDKAAFDISLPAHTRVAFARKADWFRLLARVAEKRERATLPTDAARNPRKHHWIRFGSGPARPRGWCFVGQS
jgi:hypothetical protein